MRIFVEMKRYFEGDKRENRIYLMVWVFVFIIGALLVLLQGASRSDVTITWSDVPRIWLRILPYLLLFLLHNYLVAPLLIRRNKPGAYVFAVIVLLAVFAAYMLLSRRGPFPQMRPPMPPDGIPRLEPRGGPAPGPGGPRRAPMPFSPPMLKILMGVLMVVANLGFKFQFRAARNVARVRELEKENLQQRLDTLRYQINPHFFMNTLNNIHALVDLDPDRAKESIVELSRMMRHILYDAGSPTIPLVQEEAFLKHYVALMRLRYPEGVDISLSLPEKDGGAQVPPLIFASFVENAFKHGVSYEVPSFIHISLAQEADSVIFKCTNSVPSTPPRTEEGSGIGLDNTRRRLDLLYGDRYTLHIDHPADSYEVLLTLPARIEIPAAV